MKRPNPYPATYAFVKRQKTAKKTKRPAYRPQYQNLVSARPIRAPLATRGWQFPNNGEYKVIDIQVGTIQVNTTGAISLLNGCVQGTDYTQRIGRKIMLKSLYIRGRIQTESATTAQASNTIAQLVRMIIVCDTQPNGTVFAITDLLNTATPESQLNLNNRDRFSVICDKQWVLGPEYYSGTATQAYNSSSQQIYPIKKYKKLNIETIFNAGNAGTIADMNSGALYMVWIGSTGAGNFTDANAILSSRVRFQDP